MRVVDDEENALDYNAQMKPGPGQGFQVYAPYEPDRYAEAVNDYDVDQAARPFRDEDMGLILEELATLSRDVDQDETKSGGSSAASVATMAALFAVTVVAALFGG